MAERKTTSSHIKGCILHHSELHNFRKIEVDYVRKDLSHLNENHVEVRNLQERLEDIKSIYKEKVGKKWQDQMKPIKEAVIVIDEHTTMTDLKNLAKAYEKEFGVKTLQIHIHRDEGHFNEEQEWKPNLHAHLVIDFQNKKTGKQVDLKRADMYKWQDVTATALGMKRGKSSDKKHLNHIQYKIAIEEEKMAQIKKKRLYTENPNLEIEDLRQENKNLKEELEDYKEYMYEVLDAIKELPQVGIKIAEYMKGGYNMLNSLLCHLGKIDKPKQQSNKANVYAPKYFGARNKKKGLGF